MRKIVAGLLVAAGLISLTFTAKADMVTAQDYLTNHAQDPWSTMALSVLSAGSIPTDYLKSVSGISAIDYEAPILAITAIDQDPRTFGSKDYIAELKKYDTNSQIGDTSTVNDDIFGLLALISAGEPATDTVVSDAKSFILAHQQANGGWGFLTSGGTDSNMTSAAIVALIADGVPATDTIIQNGLNFLKTAQNDDGGFTYDPQSSFGSDSDSSSTAWVIWALNAVKINPADWSRTGGTPLDYLKSNQDASGYFKYQGNAAEDSFSAATTAYAVIAIAGRTLPLHIFSAPVKTYTLTYTAGVNGSLSGSASQTVNSGANGTAVTAVPAAGFHFSGWSDGVLTPSRTDIKVAADVNVTTNFAADLASGGGGGGGGGGGFFIPPVSVLPLPNPVSVPVLNPVVLAPIPSPPGQVLGSVTLADGTLVKTVDNPTVYLVVDAKLRPFNASTIFKARGLKFSDIQNINADLVIADNLGRVVGYPDGTLIRGSGPTVFRVSGDMKVGIPSMAVFKRLKLSLKKILRIRDAELSKYDDGGTMK